MTSDPPNPASAAARTESGDAVCLSSSLAADAQANSPPRQNPQVTNPRAVREAKRLLKLEFLHECAGGIQVHAALVQTLAEIGDTAGVCYAARRLFAHVKAAHPIYLELRDGADDGAGP